MNFIKKYKFYALFLLLVVAILIWSPIVVFGFNSGVKVWFFDVGQGDAEFLDFADGNQVLIDGGPDVEILQRLGKAMPFYDKSIDLIILTHPHKDHVFGLIEVLNRYDVERVIMPKINFKSSFYKEFMNIIKLKNISVDYLSSGDSLEIGDYSRFDFISPDSNGAKEDEFGMETESFGSKGQDLNDVSLVSKFIYGNIAILFTGDAGVDIESNIIRKGYNLKSDILKVGHHGSKYSSSEEFLKSVNPDYAIIQSGAGNRYGHPTQQTLSRLSDIGAKIFRNDLNGDIVFESDGNLIFLR